MDLPPILLNLDRKYLLIKRRVSQNRECKIIGELMRPTTEKIERNFKSVLGGTISPDNPAGTGWCWNDLPS